MAALVAAADTAAAAVQLDEAETRKLIDQQLNQAGWIADSATLTCSAGARPEKGKNMAIAEWPTANGPADYMLFSGFAESKTRSFAALKPSSPTDRLEARHVAARVAAASHRGGQPRTAVRRTRAFAGPGAR